MALPTSKISKMPSSRRGRRAPRQIKQLQNILKTEREDKANTVMQLNFSLERLEKRPSDITAKRDGDAATIASLESVLEDVEASCEEALGGMKNALSKLTAEREDDVARAEEEHGAAIAKIWWTITAQSS